MTTWVTRIKARMKELNITQEMLAQKMGITRGAITHYVAGRRVPPLKQFQKLASVLKSDPAWLQFGSVSPSKSKAASEPINREQAQPRQHPVPILSWEQAAELPDVSKLSKNEIVEFIPHYYSDRPRWYALRIKGDSMVAALGQINSFHEGTLIIVDPDKQAAHGNFVIALLPRAKEGTFKQYVVDGGIHYLKPLNPQYPIIEVDKGTHIGGVVIGCMNFQF